MVVVFQYMQFNCATDDCLPGALPTYPKRAGDRPSINLAAICDRCLVVWIAKENNLCHFFQDMIELTVERIIRRREPSVAPFPGRTWEREDLLLMRTSYYAASSWLHNRITNI